MIHVIWEGQTTYMMNPGHTLSSLTVNVVEMERNKSFALCCGAGGAQMFKEAEKGDKEIFIERTEDALQTEAKRDCYSLSFLHDDDDRRTQIQEQGGGDKKSRYCRTNCTIT